MAVIRAATTTTGSFSPFTPPSSPLATSSLPPVPPPSPIPLSPHLLRVPTYEVGMEQWNELDDEYAFVYMNPENGSKNVLVKCFSMNDKLLVDALADRSFQPVHLKIDVGDYVGEDGGSNYSAQFKNLENLVDNSDEKLNPQQPNFKHKDMGEALWLSRNDPPWIEKQLQLLDERKP
ncbi:hypothetical protein C1H46_009172 [Malus baccata]|uniref:PI31 proteasome regulator N-terminal domain-containing protein n=1 Tax=Malus baccata TaxID=106549 RepID=A0A540N3S8_MALBA|nr:hypothetical protein C1H46_009172 [Malus baccata]